MMPLRVFIGYDPAQSLAYHVLVHSILTRASRPVAVIPLVLRHVMGWLYTRPRDPWQSTDFTYTRFLVPYLSGYVDYSVYLDCDMLCVTDLYRLYDIVLADLRTPFARERYVPEQAVWVCQHDYTPVGPTKMGGQAQTNYPRKNWSSLVVFNNARCRALSPAYVNAATGLALHRFAWLSEKSIGALPLEWNYLVGEPNQSSAPPRIVHFTNGGPWLPGYEDVEWAEAWRDEYKAMLG